MTLQSCRLPMLERSEALTYLNKAASVADMNLPGANLHQLKGEFKGFWSISVSGNYRLIFEFKDGDAYLVDYLDYH